MMFSFRGGCSTSMGVNGSRLMAEVSVALVLIFSHGATV
jgi:hypothetical protein